MSAPRVVVVAGVHRAGTSAIARSLAALRFDLGPRLMSADVRMNARGFFEDIDIVARNDALLALERADWKSVALLDDVDWSAPRYAQTREDARALLASRLAAATGTFAWKDPRVPRLLPFWQLVLQSLGVEEGYVVAVRHPRAVIASLTARDALDSRRSAWLWLTHVACSLAYTQRRPRVVVDYDRLVDDPAREIARVARALDAGEAGAALVAQFRDDFLAADLRHAHFAADDVGDLAPLVREAHALAQRLAGDEIDGATAAPAIDALFARVRAFSPLLAYAGSVEALADQVPRLEGELAWARNAFADCERYNHDLVSTVARKDRLYEEAQADYRFELDATNAELAKARRALARLARTRPGRLLLRWLSRDDP